MLRLFVAALTLVALSLPAEARRHHFVSQPVCVDSGDVMRPSCLPTLSQPRVAARRGRASPVYARAPRVTAASHVASHVTGGRPAGCPHAWCGCWLAAYKGLSDRSLWVARRWASLGQNAGGPTAGAIAVWPHHVGLVRAVNGNQILLLSGNDGNAVRERWRPTRGIIAYRFVS